jgi:magnesium transporter
MISGWRSEDGRLRSVGNALEETAGVVWFDAVQPTPEETAALGSALGVELPSREEMEEIEDSSRLYREHGAVFMTATLPADVESDAPRMEPVTFVLLADRLVTLRHHDPRAFRNFIARIDRVAGACSSGEEVFVSLLETVIDRLADILENAGRAVAEISRAVLRGADPPDYRDVLRSIGRQGDTVSNVQDSLLSIERLVSFAETSAESGSRAKEMRHRIRTLGRDARFLTEHAGFLSQKITFLLDATLGMIGIEQNGTIKILSVAAVVFLPPTLIASIYGMNFETMPELAWPFGYPLALGLMLGAAFLSYWFFKRKGWL